MHDISYRLKIIMGDLSERKFSERLDMAHTTVREYLKGRMPPADFVVRVCERFPGISPWWLLTGQEEAKPSVSEPEVVYTLFGSDTEMQEIVTLLQKRVPELKGNVLKMLKAKASLKDALNEMGLKEGDWF